jgi:hypothetical protein
MPGQQLILSSGDQWESLVLESDSYIQNNGSVEVRIAKQEDMPNENNFGYILRIRESVERKAGKYWAKTQGPVTGSIYIEEL